MAMTPVIKFSQIYMAYMSCRVSRANLPKFDFTEEGEIRKENVADVPKVSWSAKFSKKLLTNSTKFSSPISNKPTVNCVSDLKPPTYSSVGGDSRGEHRTLVTPTRLPSLSGRKGVVPLGWRQQNKDEGASPQENNQMSPFVSTKIDAFNNPQVFEKAKPISNGLSDSIQPNGTRQDLKCSSDATLAYEKSRPVSTRSSDAVVPHDKTRHDLNCTSEIRLSCEKTSNVLATSPMPSESNPKNDITKEKTKLASLSIYKKKISALEFMVVSSYITCFCCCSHSEI